MSQFSASNKKNPCPICGSTDNGCKTQASLILCRTFAGTKKFDYVNEHKCLGHSKDKTWAKFIHQSEDAYAKQEDFTPEQKAAWRKQQEQLKADRKAQAELDEQIAASKSLKSYERNKLYLEILNELSLHPDDRADLKRRGFTDLEIELCGFKSVERYQPLKGNYTTSLPGLIYRDFIGYNLSNDAAGYLCPIRNYYGNIVAFQIRLREPNGGSRYKWLSTPKTAILKLYPEGQNPLAVFRPSDNEPNEISLIEGVGAKPFLASRRLNSLVIGGAGGQFLSSNKFLREYILSGINDYPILDGSRKIVIYPDAGDVNNPGVMNRLRNLIEHLGKLAAEVGLDIKIAWWGQIEKGKDPDIDELTDLLLIRYLTPKQFLAGDFGTKQRPDLNQFKKTTLNQFKKERNASSALNNFLDLEALQGNIRNCPTLKWLEPEEASSAPNPKDLDRWKESREFTSQYTLEVEKGRYLKAESLISLIEANTPDDGRLNVFINASMGSGKSRAGLMLIKYTEIKEDRYAIMQSHRNNLLFQWCGIAGKENLKIYHFRRDGGQDLLADSRTHLALCPESLHRIRGIFKNRDLHFDEICAVVDQITGGGTMGADEQSLCMEVLGEAVKSCKKLICYDANLSDRQVALIQKLDPTRKTITAQLKAKPEQQTFIHITAERLNKKGEIILDDKDISPIVDMLQSSDHVPFITADSKTTCDALDEKFKLAGKFGFALHSGTVSETFEEMCKRHDITDKTWYPDLQKTWDEYYQKYPPQEDEYAFYQQKMQEAKHRPILESKWAEWLLNDPDKFFERFRPDYFIGSPTVECGFSVTIKNLFTIKAEFLCGTTNTNSQTQLPMRLRDNSLPCFLVCPKQSLVPRAEVVDSYAIRDIVAVYNRRMNLHFQESSSTIVTVNIVREILEEAEKRENKIWWDFSDETLAITNFEKKNMFACLKDALESQGHIVISVKAFACNETKKTLRDIKDTLKIKEGKEIFEADLTGLDEKKIEAMARNEPNRTQRNQINKFNLLKKLPGIENTESWREELVLAKIENPKLIIEQDNLIYLFNPDLLNVKNLVDSSYKLTKIATNRKALRTNYLTPIKADLAIGIDDLIIELVVNNARIDAESDLVQRIIQKALAKENQKYEALPEFKPSEDDPIGYIKSRLGRYGIELNRKQVSKGNAKKGTKAKHVYVFSCGKEEQEIRATILEYRIKFFENWLKNKGGLPNWNKIFMFNLSYNALPNFQKRSELSCDPSYMAPQLIGLQNETDQLFVTCLQALIQNDTTPLCVLKYAFALQKQARSSESNEKTTFRDLMSHYIQKTVEQRIQDEARERLENQLGLVEECCDSGDIEAAIFLLEYAGSDKQAIFERLSIKTKKVLAQTVELETLVIT